MAFFVLGDDEGFSQRRRKTESFTEELFILDILSATKLGCISIVNHWLFGHSLAVPVDYVLFPSSSFFFCKLGRFLSAHYNCCVVVSRETILSKVPLLEVPWPLLQLEFIPLRILLKKEATLYS